MFMGCIRDNNETGDLIETTMAYTQLEARYVQPLLHAQTLADFRLYTKKTWIHSIKESLQLVKGTIKTPKHWLPKLQCEHDQSLMTKFTEYYPIWEKNKQDK